MCNEATQNSIPTYCRCVGKGTMNEIQNQIGNSDVLIFRHVNEHLDKLNEIAEGNKEILNNRQHYINYCRGSKYTYTIFMRKL